MLNQFFSQFNISNYKMTLSTGEKAELIRQIFLRKPKRNSLRVARNLNIRGRTNMNRSELIEAIIRKLIRDRVI